MEDLGAVQVADNVGVVFTQCRHDDRLSGNNEVVRTQSRIYVVEIIVVAGA